MRVCDRFRIIDKSGMEMQLFFDNLAGFAVRHLSDERSASRTSF
jgi:hypothetical protein